MLNLITATTSRVAEVLFWIAALLQAAIGYKGRNSRMAMAESWCEFEDLDLVRADLEDVLTVVMCRKL
jgi:hypothetical protein